MAAGKAEKNTAVARKKCNPILRLLKGRNAAVQLQHEGRRGRWFNVF